MFFNVEQGSKFVVSIWRPMSMVWTETILEAKAEASAAGDPGK